jgi:sirohydrochlorin cobaltochelatase
MAAMKESGQAVILVGHGGLPKDCPPDWVQRLKRLQSVRKASGQEPTVEETDLERQIRNWPRTPESDPYHHGLEKLAAKLTPLVHPARLVVAFNEFCAPTVLEAAQQLVEGGYADITVVPSMFTPGGTHSEKEIPAILETLRDQFPEIVFHYAWPFDLDRLAGFLAEHLDLFHSGHPSS